jgi:hypothetical protein
MFEFARINSEPRIELGVKASSVSVVAYGLQVGLIEAGLVRLQQTCSHRNASYWDRSIPLKILILAKMLYILINQLRESSSASKRPLSVSLRPPFDLHAVISGGQGRYIT